MAGRAHLAANGNPPRAGAHGERGSLVPVRRACRTRTARRPCRPGKQRAGRRSAGPGGTKGRGRHARRVRRSRCGGRGGPPGQRCGRGRNGGLRGLGAGLRPGGLPGADMLPLVTRGSTPCSSPLGAAASRWSCGAAPRRRTAFPRRSQRIARRGACGKTRVVAQNHRPRSQPAEMGTCAPFFDVRGTRCRRTGGGTGSAVAGPRRRFGGALRRTGRSDRLTRRREGDQG